VNYIHLAEDTDEHNNETWVPKKASSMDVSYISHPDRPHKHFTGDSKSGLLAADTTCHKGHNKCDCSVCLMVSLCRVTYLCYIQITNSCRPTGNYT